MKKPTAFNPFLSHSQKLGVLFQSAKTAESPALFLYQNGARNQVFMLEGLARLHRNAFPDPKMEKWYQRFKKLEDLFGQIDFLDAFKKQFEKDGILAPKLLAELAQKTAVPTAQLDEMLQKKGWLDGKLLRFDKFVAAQGFQPDEKYASKITAAYKKEASKIAEFAAGINYEFTELETGVHEFRRKLRWLSIYPQAFGGLFQLEKPAANPDWSQKYLTEAIVNSPFNRLPGAVAGRPVIRLDYPAFLAMSFVIQEFGRLKDEGLQNHVLTQELKMTERQATKVLGGKYSGEATILGKASGLLKTFFADGVLSRLVIS